MVEDTQLNPSLLIDESHRLKPLDGLRGVFVAFVVLFHANIADSGGFFVAVDGFFVLSGYLITSILIKDLLFANKIGFKKFWVRRARRLLPALFFLVLVVAIGEALFGDPSLMPTVRGDCLAALFYVSNWYYIFTHVGYFGLSVVKSPLQHTWTLAIEEQYYIVWPLAVALFYKVFKKFKFMFVVTLLLSVVSAITMFLVYNNGSNVNGAYYGTETRAEALLLGSGLAFFMAKANEIPHWFTKVVGAIGPYAGITGLIVGIFAAGPAKWIFFGGFYLFDICMAVVVAYVVLFPHRIFSNIFTVRPLIFLGLISYGLYLWQYPIVQVVNQRNTGFSSWFLFIIQTVIALTLATCSFYLLERPIRFGSFFKKTKALLVAIPVTILIVVVTLIVGTLTPPIKSFAATSKITKGQLALLKNNPITVLLVGDSLAVTAGYGLAASEKQYGVHLYDQGLVGCGTLIHGLIREDANLPANPQTGIDANCAQWPQTYSNDIKQLKPDVVILMAGRWEVLDRNWGNGWEHVGQPDFDAHLVKSLEKAIRVLGVDNIPVVICTTPYFDTLNPNTGILEDSSNPARVNAYNKIVNQVVSKYTGHAYVYNLNKAVDPNGHYTEYIDGVAVRWTDGIHITQPQGGEYIAQTLYPLAVNLGLKYRNNG